MKDATFSSARLLELYDRISDAEDAIPRLRRFVLDLAVRGKLVEQDAGDEPAAELLKRIAQEKARLVKAGEIKGQIAQPPISKDDMQFGLPTGWAWTRLGEIGLVGSSSRVLQNDWQSRGVPFYRAREIVELSKNGMVDNELFISEERFQELSKKGNVPEAGDIMITGVGTIGVPYVVLNDDRFYFKDASVLIFKNIFNVNPSFMFLIMKSPYWVENVHIGSMGTTVHTLTINRAQPICLPMPPLAEQHRIVAKVDELMALCDQLERARAGREAVRDRLTTASLARLTAPETDAQAFQSHARFALQSLPILTTRPDQIKTLRQTILNLAVQGKLVEPDTNDEPAAELLKRIAKEKVRLVKAREIAPFKAYNLPSESDLAFAIPRHWEPVFVATILNDLQTGPFGSSLHQSDYRLGGIPVINPASIQNEQIIPIEKMAVDEKTLERLASFKLKSGDIVMARRGEMGRCAVVTENEAGWLCGTGSLILRPSPLLIPRFLVLIIGSPFGREYLGSSSVGATMQNLNQSILLNLPLGLPPVAEQHRIVAKVDALMALCDQLEASLTTTATTRSKLLNALLHEALGPASADAKDDAA